MIKNIKEFNLKPNNMEQNKEYTELMKEIFGSQLTNISCDDSNQNKDQITHDLSISQSDTNTYDESYFFGISSFSTDAFAERTQHSEFDNQWNEFDFSNLHNNEAISSNDSVIIHNTQEYLEGLPEWNDNNSQNLQFETEWYDLNLSTINNINSYFNNNEFIINNSQENLEGLPECNQNGSENNESNEDN